MKQLYFLVLLTFLSTTTLMGQEEIPFKLKSPESFLGYELGTQFSFHHQALAYFKHASEVSSKVKLLSYGKSNEGRELVAAVITSEENMAQLEQIRQNNLISSGLQQGTVQGKRLPIIWLSSNIHGNEAASTETAMKVLYKLISSESDTVNQWLQEMVVVLDPCENPDGRDRYVNWYKQKKSTLPRANKEAWEHHEPWPSGRYNHYVFDLNRDWAWQTQVESRQRTKLYQQWMPLIHVDLHEMTAEAPYFFGPAAEPMHEEITPWQRSFHEIAGQNHAMHFDKEGWTYFSKETYDLFYPSYGDTWPMFNGAIGFTYEQGGNGRAGLSYERASGDTLTLADRVIHHYTSSISTLEVAYKHKNELLKEFDTFFKEGSKGLYKTYVLKYKGNEGKIEALKKLLDRQQIQYTYAASNRTVNGFNYFEGKEGPFTIQSGDLVISTNQPKGKFANVLFEPEATLSDSLTYDLTAWALPYAYGIEASALKTTIKTTSKEPTNHWTENDTPQDNTYAFLVKWKNIEDGYFLGQLLQEQIQVRYATEQFTIRGKNKVIEQFEPGSLVITRKDNPQLGDKFEKTIVDLANKHKQKLQVAFTGMADSGKDLGSSSKAFLKKPNIALVGGDKTTPTDFGELWYYFEQVLQYPVTVINTENLSSVDLQQYSTIIVPSGNYDQMEGRAKLLDFAKQGGKLIMVEKAIEIASKATGTELNKLTEELEKEKEKEKKGKNRRSYAEREREQLSEYIAGSIYKVDLDTTHPIAYGEQNKLFVIKGNKHLYPALENGWNVGVFDQNSLMSGFVGYKLKKQIPGTLSIGAEKFGKGQLVYFSDSPVFRGFWRGSMMTLNNALFFDF
ncbi:M14 family metallopeptidase [Limibacter armeniacum]|uniref:M14 family metallopeptidase n=1 Tax=Limibacter armeniacum TaxID=466084 RepID=UPI002FE56942